jgi:hypothetical protein
MERSTDEDDPPGGGLGLEDRRFEDVETLCNGIMGVDDLDIFSSRNRDFFATLKGQRDRKTNVYLERFHLGR